MTEKGGIGMMPLMKKLWIFFVPVSLLLTAGCAADREDGCHDKITQVATINSLLAGVYDGSMSLGELKKHGDFGIGTFDRMDGELLLMDGTVYQVRADGKVYLPPDSKTTPFASVCFFQTDRVEEVRTPLDFPALCAFIDRMSPNRNLFAAIRIRGKFSAVKTRSVPVQNRPYKPLSEVTKTQPEFELGTVSGTVVGYRLPQYVKGVNVPGYHLHFLSADGQRGGHLLNLRLESGTVEVDELNRFYMILPKLSDDFGKADLGRDRSKELKQVEYPVSK